MKYKPNWGILYTSDFLTILVNNNLIQGTEIDSNTMVTYELVENSARFS